MKKICLLLLAVFATTVAIEAKPKEIRIFADTPRECMKSAKGRLVVEDNSAMIIPYKKQKHTRFTISKDFDFTNYKSLSFTLKNLEDRPLRITLFITNTRDYLNKFRRTTPQTTGDVYFLAPHEKREVVLNFPEPLQHPDVVKAFKLMRYTPYASEFGFASYTGNLSDVRYISFHSQHLAANDTYATKGWRVNDLKVIPGKRVKNPKAVQMSYKEFFPFIDQYGQYKYKEWPGKVHSDADLQKAREVEEADLAAHPGATDRNKYGGWANGPKQEATGRFYLKKIDGKWWFVDPEGCLWWSHGVVRVTPSSAVTPLDGRHDYFENLPKEGDEFEQFYYTHDILLKPYYTARKIKETYDFSSANCYRKYGKDYKQIYGELAHRRLQSWGLNTIANSSDRDICHMSKTPYIERLEARGVPIKGIGGWWPFRDPFDPSFRQSIIDQLKAREKELKDPYLVGLFVDNELRWGNESYLAVMIAKNPATLKGKQELVKHYKAKYNEDITALNAVWGTSFASWEELLNNDADLPKKAHKDLVEFNDKVIEKYFSTCREVFNEYAPGVLYLGCRFAGTNKKAITIGAKYSDAVSHNLYRFTIDDYVQPEGIDKPMIVGEFHFGTRDRGMFHHSLIEVKNHEERGKAYEAYVRSALEHPNIVGTHWHQFSDQATTGRFDGENFNVGFTDICDTPYYETINGIRNVGYDMYNIRANAK